MFSTLTYYFIEVKLIPVYPSLGFVSDKSRYLIKDYRVCSKLIKTGSVLEFHFTAF